MNTTNNSAAHEHDEVNNINVFGYLNDLRERLSEEEQRDAYRILLPSLLMLYETDPTEFEFATKKIARRLKIKIRTIAQDVKKLLPPVPEEEEDLTVPPQDTGSEQRGPSQATQLVTLTADVELFHTPAGEGWATIPSNDGHREHWPLKAKAFRRWLARRFYEENEKSPGAQAVQDALSVLEGKALFDGAEYPVFTRIAEYDGAIYLDLTNERWEAVEITAAGWRVVQDPPVRFRRTRGMLPLPCPVASGSVAHLKPFVNTRSDDGWILLVAWLLMGYSPRGPYPVLDLSGEQGSAKSTQARVLRSLIDPSSAPLRTVPRDERDLMISAQAGWVLAFDNLSYLPQWLSDAFCRLATGGGFATRELYTDSEEVIFDAQRPVLFTAIEDIAVNGDVIDRSTRVVLPIIPEEKRKPESLFWKEFEAARPGILGGLLNVVSATLRNLPTVKLDRLPRMADFALFVTAAEPALGWKPGTFMSAYTTNRTEANEIALEASPITTAVKKLIENETWDGTANNLLTALSTLMPEKYTKSKSWPQSPRALSNTLRRLAPNLRAVGIEVTFARNKNSRLIRIETQFSVTSVIASPVPVFIEESTQKPMTQANSPSSPMTQASSPMTQAVHLSSPPKSKKIKANDAGDAGDDRIPSRSNCDRETLWEEEL